MELEKKLENLKSELARMGKLAVAFSGGVDSTFLLKVSHDVLKNNVIAVTARSSTYPEREFTEARSFIEKLGIEHVVIVSEELDIEEFSRNPVNRCYFCKRELFAKIKEIARRYGIEYIADGSNLDDLDDFRPGMKALNEFNVISPLKDAGMTKDDIRKLSKEMELPTWDKPSFACLASRFPYGHEITREKLKMVEKAEQFLIDLGFKQVRVRHHGDIARVEVSSAERRKFFNEPLMDRVYDELKGIGFSYVALDLKGYRTGSMNEAVDTKAGIAKE